MEARQISRVASGAGNARNGAQVAAARQTIRYSIHQAKTAALAAKKPRNFLDESSDAGHLIMALQVELNRAKKMRSGAESALEKTKATHGLVVTDHAVIRFFERALGIDVQAIRDQIARVVPDEALRKDGAVYIRDGLAFIVKDRNMVTVLGDDMDKAIGEAFSVNGVQLAELKTRADGLTAKAARRAAKTLSKYGAQVKQARSAMLDRLNSERAAGWAA